MKKLKQLVFLLFILSNCNIVFSQWVETYSYYGEYGVVCLDMSFSSPQFGWLPITKLGTHTSDLDHLNINYSTDYGNSWIPNSNYVTGANHPWVKRIICTGEDSVYFFQNSEYGSRYVYSYDGGSQWTSVYFAWDRFTVDALVLSNDTGYIITDRFGTYGLINFSQNMIIDTLINTDTLNLKNSKIFFTNLNIGYLTAKDTLNNSILLFTTDGGYNWNINNKSTNDTFNNLYFTSDSVGYIICEQGKIFKTTDYGLSLIELETPTINGLNDIQFVNDSSGYCVGRQGTILKTVDYGNTWSIDSISTTNSLIRIQMFNMDLGYILGDGLNSVTLYSRNNLLEIDFLNNEPFNIYPNPTSNYLHVNINPNRTIDEINIYDMQGKKMMLHTADFHKIDISNLNAGLYFINISIDKIKYIRKVIKK